MGERKVLNRYIPPDFDPSIIPRTKRDYGKLCEIRMMLPFSMQCNACNEFMYRGKKFNSKKEVSQTESYLGIRIVRFYIKCTSCSSEITFKTDPKNADYVLESGASRNFELWRENQQLMDEESVKRKFEDETDAMKKLENKTLDSKAEIDVLDALDEIQSINQRHERIDTNIILNKLNYNNNKEEENILIEKDEEIIRNIFKSKVSNEKLMSSENNLLHLIQQQDHIKKDTISTDIIISKKRKVDVMNTSIDDNIIKTSPISIGLFQDYGSDEDN